MSLKSTLGRKLTLLAVSWVVFTVSLISWWWLHALKEAGGDPRAYRMFFWEGSSLLAVLLAGGVGLIYLTYHHERRHDRLKTFFAIFAHDLKTSITRLRLQGELLEENGDPKVKKLLKEIQRLDLQLENSLWMAQLESDSLLIQPTKLREMMDHLRNEFSEIQLEINRDAVLQVDRRAFTVVLRNLFQNSILHGEARKIEILVASDPTGRVSLQIVDDGAGLKISSEKLGKEILSTKHANSNGLGLFLSRRLVERMNGKLEFRLEPKFANLLILKGELV